MASRLWPAAPLPATRSKLAPKAVTIHQASLECTVPLSVITAILVTIAIRQTSTTQADTAILIVPAKMGSLRTLQLADIPAALLPVRQNILPALPKPAPTRVTSRPFLPGKPVLNLLLPAVILATRIVNQFITTIIHAHPAIRGKDVTTVNYIKQPTPMAAPAPAAKR